MASTYEGVTTSRVQEMRPVKMVQHKGHENFYLH